MMLVSIQPYVNIGSTISGVSKNQGPHTDPKEQRSYHKDTQKKDPQFIETTTVVLIEAATVCDIWAQENSVPDKCKQLKASRSKLLSRGLYMDYIGS